MLIMWAILVVQCYYLARREKAEKNVGGTSDQVRREYWRLLKEDGR